MLRSAIIMTFRKLKTKVVSGILYLSGLIAGYLGLVAGLYFSNIFITAASLVILTAIVHSGYPVISKKEFSLHKILGANSDNIIPMIVIQSSIISIIVSTISLAILGTMPTELVTNIKSVVYSNNSWLFPASSMALIIILTLQHLRLFSKSIPSISNKA